MVRVHDLGYAEAGTKLGLSIGIGGAVGQFGGAWLCDRLSLRDRRWLVWLPALLGVSLVPFYLAFVLADDPDLALLSFVPVTLMNAVFAAPSYTIVQGLASLRMRAMASAIMLFVLNLIGLGLGPTLVGVLNDHFQPSRGDAGIRVSLMVLLVATLWGAVHSLWAGRTLARDLDHTAQRDRG
jgi:MFS family permease